MANLVEASNIKVASTQDIGNRESQEDSYGFSNINDQSFISHAGVLAIVADGMGGYKNGGWSSVHAVKEFLQIYGDKQPQESIFDKLKECIIAANAVVYNEAKKLEYLNKMGTTLVGVVVHEGDLYWLNVGDSRIYIYENELFSCLTTDFNYAQVLQQSVDKGEISQAEADAHPMRHALTSFLGRPEPDMDLQKRQTPLLDNSWLVLCSDGLSGVLSNNEIKAELHGEPQAACDRLIAKALAKQVKHQDNVTVSIVKIQQRSAQVAKADVQNTQPVYQDLDTKVDNSFDKTVGTQTPSNNSSINGTSINGSPINSTSDQSIAKSSFLLHWQNLLRVALLSAVVVTIFLFGRFLWHKSQDPHTLNASETIGQTQNPEVTQPQKSIQRAKPVASDLASAVSDDTINEQVTDEKKNNTDRVTTVKPVIASIKPAPAKPPVTATAYDSKQKKEITHQSNYDRANGSATQKHSGKIENRTTTPVNTSKSTKANPTTVRIETNRQVNNTNTTINTGKVKTTTNHTRTSPLNHDGNPSVSTSDTSTKKPVEKGDNGQTLLDEKSKVTEQRKIEGVSDTAYLENGKLKQETDNNNKNEIKKLSENADSKNADSKNVDSKNVDSKNVDSKNADSKNADSKNVDSKNTDSKSTGSKSTGSKSTGSKSTGSKTEI